MPSLKQIGTICFTTILSLFISPSYSYITNSSNCDEDVLNTTSAPASLEANYSANTINTTWYSNGTTLSGNGVPSSCTYDSALVPPTPDARPGYTFGGWTLRDACSLASLDATVFGTNNTSTDFMGGLPEGVRWTATMPYGELYGDIVCTSTNNGTEIGSVGTPVDIYSIENYSGGYCWCRVTRYTPNGSEQCSYSDSNWVLVKYETSNCSYDCTWTCAYNVGNAMSVCTPEYESMGFCTPASSSEQNTVKINIRRALFGQSQ